MSCTQCGAQLYEGQRFCGNCGARVAASEVAGPDPAADSEPGSPDRPSWPSPQPAATTRAIDKPVVIAAIVALIVIAAGAAAYFALMRPAGQQEIAQSDYSQDIPPETAPSSPEPLPPPAEEKPEPKAGSAPKTPRASRPRSSSPAPASRNMAAARTYEAVRDTQVYEKPSASSKVVASIPRGYTVTVVGSTGNWLEVRSKSGNPPGFIRRSDVLPAIRRG
jgi:hypothetical protein